MFKIIFALLSYIYIIMDRFRFKIALLYIYTALMNQKVVGNMMRGHEIVFLDHPENCCEDNCSACKSSYQNSRRRYYSHLPLRRIVLQPNSIHYCMLSMFSDCNLDSQVSYNLRPHPILNLKMENVLDSVNQLQRTNVVKPFILAINITSF